LGSVKIEKRKQVIFLWEKWFRGFRVGQTMYGYAPFAILGSKHWCFGITEAYLWTWDKDEVWTA